MSKLVIDGEEYDIDSITIANGSMWTCITAPDVVDVASSALAEAAEDLGEVPIYSGPMPKLKAVVDPDVPEDEVHLMSKGEVICKLINIGKGDNR